MFIAALSVGVVAASIGYLVGFERGQYHRVAGIKMREQYLSRVVQKLITQNQRLRTRIAYVTLRKTLGV